MNLEGLKRGYTESWPAVHGKFDLVVLALITNDRNVRELHAGFLMDIEASIQYPGFYRLVADVFTRIGTHDLKIVSDADFYSLGSGGGSRRKIYRTTRKSKSTDVGDVNHPPGWNERRLVWVRRNHQHFRDPVWRHWQGRCAVHDHECNGILVASHIYPWRSCDGFQKTDHHNGLLLSAPMDSLFDRGLISFNDKGKILFSPKLDDKTTKAFAVKIDMRLRQDRLTKQMRDYLTIHRRLFQYE